MLSLLFLLACEDTHGEAEEVVEVSQDSYSWQCLDYVEHTEIEITVETCEYQSLFAEVALINHERFTQEMYHEGGCWWYSLILQEENCIEIQGITITAQGGGSNGW